ncbi:hypothetical protein IEQ34_012203 [Dendrobium chrysotoxum]|uniref:Uncharacterized protein n=1 Tax=Dendrobium chrysotoxum TaxID=161865 RepID=A0AAV7GC86_DENCH|nr:hypothetical protein IEQ34_012203 [Dendrobium chrysotoxum]
MDILKAHPDSVWLGPESLGYIQKVVVEGMPNFCSHCKEVGHKNFDCAKLNPQLRKVAVPVQLDAGSGPINIVVGPIVTEEVVPQVLNELSNDNVGIDLPLLNVEVLPQDLNEFSHDTINVVVPHLDQEVCGNIISRDVGSPVMVGNLDPSPGVALAGSDVVGPSNNVLVSSPIGLVGCCEVDKVVCQANTMMVDDLSNGSDPSDVGPMDPQTLVDVSIGIISPNVLNNQLTRSGDTYLEHSE